MDNSVVQTTGKGHTVARTRKYERFASADTAMLYNGLSFIEYMDRMTELALTMFEWKNLPDTINEDYLEKQLFYKGKALFFKDEVVGYLALQCIDNGGFDVYGIPKNRYGKGYNAYLSEPKDETNSVIIYNNRLHKSTYPHTRFYARKMWNMDRTIDVNISAQKTPVLLQGTEGQRLTLKNVYEQYDGNQPVIFGTDKFNTEGFTVLKTEAPFIAPQLYTLKIATWNEYLTHLGISNTAFEKRERLVSDEVVRSQGGTIASRYSRLDMRRKACEEINRMFGLDIWVDYKEDYRLYDITQMVKSKTESKDGGEIVDMIPSVSQAEKASRSTD